MTKTKEDILNTILLPLVAAVATASAGLLVQGDIVMGGLGLILTIIGSYAYQVLP